MNRISLLLILLLVFFQRLSAQYILNGSAQKVSCNCYTLTNEQQAQSGSVWNSNKIDLRQSFDFWFNVFLGCRDANGADGMVFILQPISTSVGSSGEGMGFGGVSPSIGIALDTYQNNNLADPAFDHISIQSNGVIHHSSDLAGPLPISASADNVEDCQWHTLRITWDASAKWLRTYFDGVLRVEKQIDLITTIFSNDPSVYWGFTGGTGGSVNLQQFCTALNPKFTTNAANNVTCEGSPVQFSNTSESFAPIAKWDWDFGDGTTSNSSVPQPHLYTKTGKYQVKLKVTGQDGCEKDTVINITIAPKPTVGFSVFDTCAGNTPRLQVDSFDASMNFQWKIDATTLSINQKPLLDNLPAGTHNLQLTVSSIYNCGTPAAAAALLKIEPKPEVEAKASNGCIGDVIDVIGLQKDATTTIDQWQWDFGDRSRAFTQNAKHKFGMASQYDVQLWAKANNGCSSDTAIVKITINEAIASAGNDTVAIVNQPFHLNGKGNGSYSWSPSVGLSDPFIANPETILTTDSWFVLSVITPEGCTSSDTVVIKVYKGPAVYVPSAFTPNGDGRNDILRPIYAGIKTVKQFAVFNRWGQQVFQTSDRLKGWEGKDANEGTYVWLATVITMQDQPLVLKGTVTIIR